MFIRNSLFALFFILFSECVIATPKLEVGLSSGSFRVDESGAATYSIPFSMAPGRAGVAPVVGLSYSSNNTFGGVVGVGWSISGLSSISRCPQTPIHDDGNIRNVRYDAEDKFCIDGQRLLLYTGTYGADLSTYKTEIDTFSTIEAKGQGDAGGPKYFVVRTKSGETHYYGDPGAVDSVYEGGDAFIEPGGYTEGSIAQTWAIKAIEDVKGNYIRFNYTNNHSDEFGTRGLISSIDYAGNRIAEAPPFAEVKFKYKSYSKGFSGYSAGAHVTNDQLLERVDIRTDNQNFRSYYLEYENSGVLEERVLLESVQECDSDSYVSATCFPKTEFTWQRPNLKNTQGPNPNTYNPFSPSYLAYEHDMEPGSSRVFDFNGDGYNDLIFVDNGSWQVSLGPDFGTPEIISSTGADDPQYALNIDYDGDGVIDILVADSQTADWYVLSYGDSEQIPILCPFYINGCNDYTITRSGSKIALDVQAKGRNGFAQVMDVDGDGMADIVFQDGPQIKAYMNSEGSFTEASNPLFDGFDGQAQSLLLNGYWNREAADMKSASGIDINGDGRSDLIVRIDSDTSYCRNKRTGQPDPMRRAECEDEPDREWINGDESSDYQLFISEDDSQGEPTLKFQQDIGEAKEIEQLRVADFNGDGLTDVAYVKDDYWHYRLSNGIEFLNEQSMNLSTTDNTKLFEQFVDLNGDGRADILHAHSASSWHIYISHPDSVPSSVKFGFRGVRNFEEDSYVYFGDINGDGKANLITVDSDAGEWRVSSNRSGIKEYVIGKITNGFGVDTDIEYAPMTDTDVYFMQASDTNLNSDVFSPVSGAQVVSRVQTESNTGSSVAVSYQYGGLLIHKKGRGSLGFEVLKTEDEQSNVVTETIYNQSYADDELDGSHFATSGMPLSTKQTRFGVLMSLATNTPAVLLTTQDSVSKNSVMPYIAFSEEEGYTYNSDLTSKLVSTTDTTNVYDKWGNLITSTVAITDEIHEKTLQTVVTNEFESEEASDELNVVLQRLGRLQTTTVTKSRTGQLDITRKTRFKYENDVGLLRQTILSPEKRFSMVDGTRVAALDLTTTYGYDQWGNQTSVTINGSSISNGAAPQSGTERKTKLIYDDTGRFLKHKYLSYIAGENEEATGEKVSYKYNGKSADDFEEERLKNITTTDDNGVSSTQHFSSLGLETTTTRTGNLTDKILRKYCEDDCPAGSYSIALSSDGKPLQTTFFDKWGRPRIKRTVGFDGQDIDIEITYDAQGRKKRITEPNSSTFFTEYSYDEIGRVDLVNNPSGSKVIISNNELVMTTTLDSDEDDRTTTEEMNAFGETYRTTDALGTVVSFTYNSFGNMLTATTSLGSEVSDIPNSSTITNFYDDWGHKYRTDDPDKGIWNYTYNVFGELYTQRTARGHTFTFSYDRQGRKVRSYNASEGTLCWIYGEDTAKHNVGKLWKARKFSGQNISLENCGNGNPEVGKVYNYNSLGLRKSVTTTVDNHSYFESQTYDEYLRPSVTTFPESSTGDVVAVRKYYNTFHYLNSIVDYSSGDDGITLKEIISVSDRGQVTNMTLGNGVTVDNSYAPSTGWFESSSVSNGTTLYSVDIDSYYTSGNIEQRTSKYATSASAYTEFAETYVYDELNRLTNRSYSVKEAGTALLPGAFTKDHTYGYDYWGNIKNKTGVGYYKYDDTKAHRLVGVSTEEYMADEGVFDVYDMSYDESGNILYDGNRHFEYSTFDKPTLIYTDDNMASSSMRYGVARELVWKQDCFNDGQGKKTQVTTTYIGAFQKLEKMSESGALVENKYNIGDIVITYRSNGTSDTNYLHSDHQGSVVAISDDAGNVVTQAIYDPFGKRTEIYKDSLLGDSISQVDRGYTGHKHIAALDIIHMNGRIYDPTLGRFLQADPFIQDPGNSQSYNRYSYLMNNPLNGIDPSGYLGLSFIKKAGRKLIRGAAKVFGAEVVGIAGNIASMFCGPAAAACAGAWNYEFARAMGASSSGALRGAFTAAATVYAFQQIGSHFRTKGLLNTNRYGYTLSGDKLYSFGGNPLTATQIAQQIASHAVVGGISAELQGGKFGHGFVSAGVTKGLGGAFLPSGSNLSTGDVVEGTVVSAVIGGTASVISGGKFANGANTAAFQYLFNQAFKNRPKKLEEVASGPIGPRNIMSTGDSVPIYRVTKAIHRIWYAEALFTDGCANTVGGCIDTQIIEEITIYAQKGSNYVQLLNIDESVVASPTDWFGPGYLTDMTTTHTHYQYSGTLINYYYKIERTVHIENETFSLIGN